MTSRNHTLGAEMIKTLQGFKDFVMRGNVVDLAVGIVIGAAFTALVGTFTAAFIQPLLQLFGANAEEGIVGGKFTINGVVFPWNVFVNGIITFLITAAVLYFLVVVPMNRLAERRKRGEEPEPKAPSEEIRLLTEIRDALQGGAVPHPRPVDDPASAEGAVLAADR
jgi:large conductance mechanosensitive channel